MSKKFMAVKKSGTQIALALILCVVLLVLTACANGGTSNSPSPEASPTAEPLPAVTVTVSPEITPSGENAPGAVTEATPAPLESSGTTTNKQSPLVEEAVTITAVAEKIKGIEDAAAVVTDDKKCVVALKLKPDAALDESIRNQIKAAASEGTDVRVTADAALYDQITKLEKEVQNGKTISFEEVKAAWEKIK